MSCLDEPSERQSSSARHVRPVRYHQTSCVSRMSAGRARTPIQSPRESALGGPTVEEARRLLERAHILREPADFDLLVFFARHPRTLLASESLAALLGNEAKDIPRSLEPLLECGLLTRTQTAAHAARLYVFAADAPHEWLPPLLKMATTGGGRLALRQLLANRPRERPMSSLSVVPRMSSDTHGEPSSDSKTG